MADTAKRGKIADARKKLKQFQQKGNKASNNSSPTGTKGFQESFDTSDQKENSRSSLQSSNYQKNQLLADRSTPPLSEKAQRPTSSTESLHQLSRHMNDLLQESATFINGEPVIENSSITELEQRNRELASLLEKHTQANEQLNNQVQQVRQHAEHLQQQLNIERSSFEERQKKDVGSLKEQLQVHIQTIGILVAEKTELQSQINQIQKLSDQRLEEIDELGGRLRASRQRVADLERSLSTTSSSNLQHETSSKEYSKEVDRLKLDLYKANKLQEDLKQQNSELHERLNAQVAECSGLEHTAGDLRKKLEMAEVYAQQLSNQTDSTQESVQLVNSLQHEKEELMARIQQYSEAFQKVSGERDQLSEQYQRYIDQLQSQAQQLTKQVTSLTEEKEKLLSKQQHLTGTVSELQQKLETLDSQTSSDKGDSLEQEKLKMEFKELSKRHDAQIRDNSQLSRFLEEKESKIMELELTISTLGEEAGDKAQLLEDIQSDKTALSRALAQNKDLKLQLAELQNGFVKMSNDNMEILTKLQTEDHRTKELATRLAQQEDELKDVREALAMREAQLNEVQKTTLQAQRENFQQDQIHDRLQHYEAQAQLVETLQQELRATQDMVDTLTAQNSELRTMLIKSAETRDNPDSSSDDNKDQVLDSLSATIQQLEAERNQLMENLKEQRNLSDNLSVKIADLQEEVVRKSAATTSTEREIVTKTEFEKLQTTMDLVQQAKKEDKQAGNFLTLSPLQTSIPSQDKYTKAMREKADLSDKADQLEHLVLQLQGETDTIGEYISLYHHQRALLQQREFQKNDYIAQLAKDREELQSKLNQLQGLVMQMLGEKSMLHSYNTEAQQHLCHDAAMHSTDSKIQPHLTSLEQGHMVNGVSSKLNNEWPDYSSSSSESEVEAILAGEESTNGVTLNKLTSTLDTEPENHLSASKPQNEHTAKQILDLLSEIGQSSMPDTLQSRKYLPCKYCKGRILDL